MPYQIIFTDSLSHHGIKGQKWGVRRFQNEDGSYKPGAQGRYNDDGVPGPNKSRSGKSVKSNKSKRIKTAAIIAGTVAVTAAIVYAKKSGALDRGADFIKSHLKKEDAKKPISQVKPKENTIKELEKLGIQTPFSKPKIDVKTQIPTTQVQRTQIPRAQVQRTQIPTVQVQRTQTSKKLSDFEFNRLTRVDSSGKASYINVPKDKAGYAKSFAQQMAKGKTSGKDYEYWLNYMENKLKGM